MACTKPISRQASAAHPVKHAMQQFSRLLPVTAHADISAAISTSGQADQKASTSCATQRNDSDSRDMAGVTSMRLRGAQAVLSGWSPHQLREGGGGGGAYCWSGPSAARSLRRCCHTGKSHQRQSRSTAPGERRRSTCRRPALLSMHAISVCGARLAHPSSAQAGHELLQHEMSPGITT